MNYPKELNYTKDHEWIETKDKKIALVGVTSYAIEQLGDIVHVDLPKIGQTFKTGDSFGTIESTKTVSDLYIPVGGKIIEINQDIVKKPESLQSDAYQKGWLVKVELTSTLDSTSLMNATQYETYLKDQEH